MPERNATLSNVQDLGPEVLRNEIVDNADQMNRIQVGDGAYAAAMNTFPLVNLDDPSEGYYTVGGARGPMTPTALTSESPIGQLDLPSKEAVSIQAYKKKYSPDKGVETHLSNNTPFSIFSRAASILRLEIFMTREQVSWRGDEAVEGFIGPRGNDAHDDIASVGHVDTPTTAWSDRDAATVYSDLTGLSSGIMDNGVFTEGESLPTVFASPSVVRDMRGNADLEDRVSGVRIRSLGNDDVQEIMSDDIGRIRTVMVNVPRTNAAGEYVDADGNVVDNVDDAAMDNILEPWDPDANAGAGGNRRNVVIGRPGTNSAYFPWFLDRLTERASNAPDPGSVSVESNNGFFTQVWNEADPLTPYFKAAQEIGFHVQTPENWAILQNV